ncbi:MAG TPA: LacI family DNA-binding transcriptional regulator [Solirubrobacteraceae bacterium]|nr:LacI family DNA-binding transcriptional regulator [Solirubrobacteraceae bacterium]
MATKTSLAGPATLRDVARVAGVHPGTVSRALNPQTRGLVNERTARRVLAAAEELGYRPNPIARGLRTNRSNTIGVLVPDLLNPLFAAVVRGIEDGLREAGYTPLIANTDNDAERERVAYEAMSARQVDGFIAATARRDHWLLADRVESGPKLVLVNRRVDSDAIPAVTGDDHEGVRLAVEHLAELGHRRIAHLAGSQTLYTGWSRHQGFRDGMRASGLEVDDGLIVFSEAFTVREGARCCGPLLDRRRDFTAIVAGNDLLALGCYDALAERGLRCPEDVSLVGYNDMPFADRFRPALTTIRIPHYELGATAAALMLDQLQERAPQPRQVLLAPELVVRSSTASVRRPSAAPTRVSRVQTKRAKTRRRNADRSTQPLDSSR